MNVHPALQELAEKFIKTYCETFPLESIYYGLPEYYPLLQYPNKAQIESYSKFLENLSHDIKTISELDGLDKIDQEVFQVIIDLEQFMLSTAPYEALAVNPANLVLRGIHDIVELHTSDEEKLRLIISRLQSVLPLFETCKPTWENATILDLENIPTAKTLEPFLTAMVTPFLEKFPHKTPVIKNLIETVDEKGKAFAHWVEDEISPEKSCHILGKELYEKLLHVRKEGHTWEERLHIGETNLKRSKTRLQKLAQKIVPEGTVKNALSKVKGNFVENLVEESHTAHENVVTFLKESNLLHLPDYPFQITEPPEWDPYLREGMIAASMAGILLKDPLLTIHVVPPSTEKGKKELNRSFILLGMAHEGAAGHLGSFALRKERGNIVRLLTPLDTGIDDGWTFYWEQLLREEGIEPTTEYEFFQEYRVFWCSLRHICDVSLHCGLMSFEECVEFLEKEGDVSPLTAKGYVKLIAIMPGYFSSFIIGKEQLLNLRTCVKRELGHLYSPDLFHKWIGEAGPIPSTLLRREIRERITQMNQNHTAP